MPDPEAMTRARPAADPSALPLEEARRLIAARIEPLVETERIALGDALGRIVADDIVSPIDVPSEDNSAMDGYALRAADLDPARASTMRAVGIALAGRPYARELSSGDCVRIMTGATMPPGTDTVVPQELTDLAGEVVTIPAGQQAGQHLRRRGEDLPAGSVALRAGTRIRAAELGLLASLGVQQVCVVRRLRVAILSTGDELRQPGETPGPGTIYDSNRYTLTGMLRRLDIEVIDLGAVGDDPQALQAALKTALDPGLGAGARGVDAVITSGGVAQGEADFTRRVLLDLGDVAFWRIAMKPGQTMAFGHLGEGPSPAFLFGLPGNPVAVMVTFFVLVREALERLAGAVPRPMPLLTALTDTPLQKKTGRTEYQRAIAYPADDGWHVRVTGAQGSGILRSMSEANCLIVLPHDSGSVALGERVSALPFEGLL